MRIFGLFAVVAMLAAPAVCAEVVWQSDPEAALAQARKEEKLLLVHFRSAACESCNRKGDATFEKLSKDDVFVGALDAFVPLRVTGPLRTPIEIPGTKVRNGAAAATYDASGIRITLLDNSDLEPENVVEALLRVRNVRSLVVKSAFLRNGGNVGSADFALGHALLAIQEAKAARERFESAARVYAQKNDRQSEQLALVGVATATYAAGVRFDGHKMIDEVLRDPASNTVAAEAHYRRGTMMESDAHGTVYVAGQPLPPRRGPSGKGDLPLLSLKGRAMLNRQRLESAIESYRKAYELAVRDSMTYVSAREALTRLDPRPLPSRGSTSATLRLVPPARQSVTGVAQFRAEAAENVARVDFFLDEKPVASARKAPFTSRIDLGPIARARVVKARAFDGSNNPVGEAVVTVNDRADVFSVSIIAPVAAAVSGVQTVEADVRVPPERTLRSVELSWNGQPFATLTGPPLRAELTADHGLGYLKVVATLDDGTTAEATRVYNAVVADSVEVGAVTLLVSVLDRNEEPVRGLRAEDFIVHDAKQPVAVTLRSSQDEPVTLGIAVDSSASMSGKQLYVIRSAAEFLGRALRPQDEAFVVAFSNAAWLAHPRSPDVAVLRSSVLSLTPAGGTAMLDGVTLALQQFQGLGGKKALLVFSDGREGTSSSSPTDLAQLANVVGVPIYLVVPPGGLKYDHALRTLSESTGGVMMHAIPLEEFGDMAEGLADEVRSQYVLSFTRPSGVHSGAWREIKVRVRSRDDVTVRTIQGYRAN